jgi:hypothetical protein
MTQRLTSRASSPTRPATEIASASSGCHPTTVQILLDASADSRGS